MTVFRNQELIDTCWDVNVVAAFKVGNVGNELIDTCWDVNNYDAISILADRLN